MNGYGSHEPALRAIARFTKIESVIEFGAGESSTYLFLDRNAYPDLKSLTTFEHNPGWAERLTTNDERHTMIIEPSAKFAEASAGMKADFVFLDSGPTITHRMKLVEPVSLLAPILAIHDIDKIVKGQDFQFRYVRHFNEKIQVLFLSNSVDLTELELL